MTTLSERVERLREQREHWHCPCGELNVSGHPFRAACMSGDGTWCTDYHGDPREAYLDALALAWEIAPQISPVWDGLIQEELTDLAAYVQEDPR